LSLGGPGRDLPEDGELGQFPQPIGERGAWNAQRRTERFECLCSEEGLADDQERPGVGDDVQRARDRTVALASSGARSDQGRCGPWLRRGLPCLDLGGDGHSGLSILTAAATVVVESAPLPQRRG